MEAPVHVFACASNISWPIVTEFDGKYHASKVIRYFTSKKYFGRQNPTCEYDESHGKIRFSKFQKLRMAVWMVRFLPNTVHNSSRLIQGFLFRLLFTRWLHGRSLSGSVDLHAFNCMVKCALVVIAFLLQFSVYLGLLLTEECLNLTVIIVTLTLN